jgi:hypothetical protein
MTKQGRKQNPAAASESMPGSDGASSPASAEAEERIRRRAYELYVDCDGADGDEVGDWLQAEREYFTSRNAATRAPDSVR